MNTHNTPKKQPAASATDWHPADIIAALRKAGWSLRRLSVHHGYYSQALAKALVRSWPKAERAIAEAIGVAPEVIWPERHAERAAQAASGVRRRGRRPDTLSLDLPGDPAKDVL